MASLSKSAKGELCPPIANGADWAYPLTLAEAPGEQDRAVPVRDHATRGLLSHQEAGEGAHDQRPFDLVGVEPDERAACPAAGVEDDDVGNADAAFDFLVQVGHLGRVDRVAAKSLRARLCAQIGELVGISRREGDAHALACEQTGERGAEATACADNQCCFISGGAAI